MSLWRDLNNPRLRDLRAAEDVAGAAISIPVTHGVAESPSHTSHDDEAVAPVRGTIRTVAAHSCEWCKVTPVGVLHMDGKDGRL